MKYTFFYIGALLSVAPSISYAHAKWFVDAPAIIASQHGIIPFYGMGSLEVLVWSGLTLIIVLLFSIADTFIPEPKKLIAFAYKYEYYLQRLIDVILGVFFISVGVFWELILAPNLHAVGPVLTSLQYVEVALGILLLTGLFRRTAALGIFALYCSAGIIGGYQLFFENALLPSFAAYIYLNAMKGEEDVFNLKRHAGEIIRIGAAFELIALALTEKLFYPELTIRFIEIYKWNFMQPIFPWYSDALLTLSTGFAQGIFGILFLMGYLTRITTVSIAAFFVTSMIAMLAQTGVVEIEDLPVYAAAVVLFFFGHGKTKFFHFMWPESILHKPLIRRKK
ncbi:MAG: hypothetical protein WAX38_03425 [Minisyncoccia bacterium]